MRSALCLATLFSAILCASCASKAGTADNSALGGSGLGGVNNGRPGAGTGALAASNGTTPGVGGANSKAGSGAPVTAGTGGSGSNPSAAGGGASPVTSGGGYIVTGKWMGYAWTAVSGAGTTIMPKDFAGIAAGAPLCAMGSVAATTDYSGIALLGLNLNQAAAPNAPLMAVTPSTEGVMIEISNSGNSPLRLQIQAPDGDTVPEHRWCAPISGTGGLMKWSTFNTKCWDNSGANYANEALGSIMVTVPGTTTAAVPFNFCLKNIAEGGAATGSTGSAGSGGTAPTPTAGTGGSSNPGMGSGTLTGQYDWHAVTKDGRNYIVQNNVWGGNASQTVAYSGTTFDVTQQTGSNATTGAPVSYPSVFIGSNNGHTTSDSNLPKQVSALGSVQTTFSHNAGPAVSGTYNASYDVWFSTAAGGDSGPPSGGYLMVWLHDPQNAQPISSGGISASGVEVAGVAGTWDVWIGQQMGKPCVSYVRKGSVGTLTFDLNLFIKDAVSKRAGTIQSSWYLTNVFAGFEIWSGGTGLKATEFSAVVN